MRKRVLLLAVSCKTGGLCPGGIDMDEPNKWIRIVSDDGHAGAVQGHEIDFAKPLDIIQFEGRHMPQGIQLENWVIDNNSCIRIDRKTNDILDWAYEKYSYKGFWGNYKSYLNEQEFSAIKVPTESFMKVSNVRIYLNERDKAKIDFDWFGAKYRIKGVSMTDLDYYNQIRINDVIIENAYILTSIPKEIDDWVNPNNGEKQAYKFVSKIYKL